MTERGGCPGGNQTVGKAEEEGKRGRRGRIWGYQGGDGMKERGSDELLPAAGRKGYREVLGE